MTFRILALCLLLSGCAGGPRALPYEVSPDIAYRSEPAPRQYGQLFRPAGAGPFPAVLVIHGGGWIRGEPQDVEKYAERFAQAGYVAFNVGYRLAPEHPWPAQIEDVRAALYWLRDHADELNIDSQRIGAMGYSAGGHLALMLGLQEAEFRPAAVISGAGPTDLRIYPRSPYILKLIGAELDAQPVAWADASPLTHVTPDDVPVMMFHGRLDQLVDVEQSEMLAAALAANDVPHRLRRPLLAGHITNYLFDGKSFAVALDFFAEHLAAPGP